MMRPEAKRIWACRNAAAALLVTLLWAPAIASSDDGELHFTILHTNDEHSALLPSPLVDYHPEWDDPTVGGFARLGRLVKDMRAAKEAADEPVVVVSAADILGGAPHFWLIPFGESPEITLLHEMGYDVVTIGNHEFDYGSEILGHYYLNAGYPEANAKTALVCSNLVIPGGHPLGDAGILDTHTITLDNGLTLGFFGLLGHYAARLATMMDPVEASDPVEAARAAVQSLREQGADIVIGVSHSGLYEDEPIVQAVPGIDLMVSGHCHTALHEPMRVNDTLLVQAGGYLQYLGVLELAYNPATGTLRVRNEENDQPFLVRIDDSIEKDPGIEAMIAGYTEQLNALVARLTDGRVTDIHEHVLHTDFLLEANLPRQESVFGNFVADAMRLAVEEATGERVDLAIQANGVIRGSVRPGTMPYSEGMVTFYDLATSVGLGMGFDGNPGYPLASIYLTGNEIYRMLETSLYLSDTIANIFYLQISGARFSYDPKRTSLFRIPFTQFTLPTFRAVRGIEMFTDDGLQVGDEGAYRAIRRGDDTLYHVVCDAYILSFFPRVAEMLPFYPVIPKDRDGNPLAFEDAILQTGDGELKVWQAVVSHALSQPPGEGGIPKVAAHYGQPDSRIIHEAAPFRAPWALPALAILLPAGLLWRRRRRARNTHASG